MFNSLSRKEEEFTSIKRGVVGIYTCGPTVYSTATIGNWRTYLLSDVVLRTLLYLNYEVKYVMNLTDVGHLTGDNLGDADLGEDRLEKAAKSEGKNAWDIAKFYTEDFMRGFEALNFVKPEVFCKATDHIKEQIELVKKIEGRGFAYKITDGIYFDTLAYEKAGNTYGELSNLDRTREARVEENKEKRNERDFALWKFSPVGEKRHMEWESPWGVGFPGWHIECSAMSMKYLGEQFDLHLGGEDLKSTHHPNEIAQSEAVTGKKPFVKYWMHGAFLLVDGGKMGKSCGNAYTLQDLEAKGFSPMDLRYFYLTGHYRKQLNFTWEALGAARTALARLRESVTDLGEKDGELNMDMNNKFTQALEEDFNTPKALAVMWEVVKSALPDGEKRVLIEKFDEVMGLGLSESRILNLESSEETKKLITQREKLRREKKWEAADEIRDRLIKMGVEVKDK